MKMCFVSPVLPASIVRPIIRLHKPRIAYNNAHTDLTDVELFQFCTGYDIL